MKAFNSAKLAAVLSDLLLAEIPDNILVSAINTDTRSLQVGQTFAAVRGDRFDGHDFIETALSHGANALIVEEKQTAFVPQIIVTNTRLALGRIAAAVRDDFVQGGGKVVGLTGSAGKTTNKQMLASIFSQVGHTHATKGNLNNDLGVPFTWFAVPEDAEFAVIEMGANHQGEIDYLAGITRPQVAMITNAGEAHLEGFGGLDGVAKGKGELFQQLLAGDTAVINLDDNYADYWRGLLAEGVAVKTFSLHNADADADADVFATDINDSGQFARFTLNADGKKCAVSLPVGGWHNVMNALGCTACALALDVDLTAIVAGLEQFEGAKGRLQTYSVGTLTVIDDTYNANPLSMRASSDILAAQDGYKIMVIGEMGELGDDALQLHADLGRDLQGKADVFLCLGDNMTAFADNNDRATHFSDLETLNNTLLGLVKQQPSATVLVKGSRSMQMERVIKYLQEQEKK